MKLNTFCRYTMWRTSSISRYFSNNAIPSFSAPLFIPTNTNTSGQNQHDTKITKLNNGLIVATQNQYSLNAVVGVFVKGGPRYEMNYKNGVSQFIEKLAFQSTENITDREEIQVLIDQSKALSDCQLARDYIVYGMSGELKSLNNMIYLLSEVVLSPRYTDEEIELAKQVITHESHMMTLVPPPDNLLSDLIHRAGYRNNTYGLPRYAPPEMIESINRNDVLKFRKSLYQPNNVVIVAVGVEHEEALQYAEKHFVPKFANVERAYDGNVEAIDKSVPQITRGEVKLEQDLSQYHLPMPEYAYISLGFESPSYNDSINIPGQPSYVTSFVLQHLLGGGSSFSSGGPGKGMYSRFYTQVLNRHGFVNSAISFSNSYSDCGMFTLTGSSPPSHLGKLAEVLINQLHKLSPSANQPVSSVDLGITELDRAKKLAKSSLMMNLEMRNVAFEDIGRQIIYSTDRMSRRHPDDLIIAIEKVTKEDIVNLVQSLISSHPSIAGFGKLKDMPSIDAISKMIANNERFLPRIFNNFF